MQHYNTSKYIDKSTTNLSKGRRPNQLSGRDYLSWMVKEGNLLLVCSVLCSIGLHSLPIDLEHSIILLVEQIYRAIGACLMNDEWSDLSGFKFARKKVEFGIIQEDLIPLFEVLASYHLIMPFFRSFLCNLRVQVGIIR